MKEFWMIKFDPFNAISTRDGTIALIFLVIGAVSGGIFTFLLLMDMKVENSAREICDYQPNLQTEHDACKIEREKLTSTVANLSERSLDVERLIFDSIDLSDENPMKKKLFLRDEYVTVGEKIEINEKKQTFTLSFAGEIFPGGYVEVHQKINPYKISYDNIEYRLDISIEDDTRLFFEFSRVDR